VIAVASAVLLALGPARPLPGDVFAGVGGASFLVLSLTFAGEGAIVAWRVPGNRIGWVFCVTGILCGITVLAWAYADYGLNASEALPGVALAAGFPSEPVAPFLGFAMLVSPTGACRPAAGGPWRPCSGSRCCSCS
jgi:hypothetical protein